MKKFLSFLIIVFLVCAIPKQIYAQTGNFSSSADVTYTVSENGLTHVKFAVSLTNNTSTYYASQYDITVGFADIQNIQAHDATGKLSTIIERKQTYKTIATIFTANTVGLKKVIPFVVEFDTSDVMQHAGSTWEVTIPSIANQKDFDTFLVHVSIPPSFGSPSYIKPAQQGTRLDFTKEQLANSGISIGFGSFQTYKFSLNYHLRNPHWFPQSTEIALPADTNYQTVSVQSLTPRPSEVTRDDQGNWLAKYTLWPRQTLEINAVGKTIVSLAPQTEMLTQKQRTSYLLPQRYWESSDPTIVQTAKQLKTPNAIYHFVVNTLMYDYAKDRQNQIRLGAIAVMKNRSSAVCLEFTDLFIALSRASGIPAREVDGYGYTNNDTNRPISLTNDILHAWPEYYDDSKQAWIMVDPTWNNTSKGTDYFSSLDLDHLAFVIKGDSSTYPVSAGGYKLAGKESSKDVSVSIASDPAIESSTPVANISLDSSLSNKNQLIGTVTITNPSGTAIRAQDITLVSDIFVKHNQTISIQPIPPFGSKTINLQLEKTAVLTNMLPIVTIQIGSQKIETRILLLPFISKLELVMGGIFIGIITICIFAITKRARNLFIFGRKE